MSNEEIKEKITEIAENVDLPPLQSIRIIDIDDINGLKKNFEAKLFEGYIDYGLIKFLDGDKEYLDNIIQNIDNEELREQLKSYIEIDIFENIEALKDLKKALEYDDTISNENTNLAWRLFEYWLAERQFPIKIARLYMFMGIENNHFCYKNRRYRTLIWIGVKELEYILKKAGK